MDDERPERAVEGLGLPVLAASERLYGDVTDLGYDTLWVGRAGSAIRLTFSLIDDDSIAVDIDLAPDTARRLASMLGRLTAAAER